MSVHEILLQTVWYLFCFFSDYVDPRCNKRGSVRTTYHWGWFA